MCVHACGTFDKIFCADVKQDVGSGKAVKKVWESLLVQRSSQIHLQCTYLQKNKKRKAKDDDNKRKNPPKVYLHVHCVPILYCTNAGDILKGICCLGCCFNFCYF